MLIKDWTNEMNQLVALIWTDIELGEKHHNTIIMTTSLILKMLLLKV